MPLYHINYGSDANRSAGDTASYALDEAKEIFVEYIKEHPEADMTLTEILTGVNGLRSSVRVAVYEGCSKATEWFAESNMSIQPTEWTICWSLMGVWLLKLGGPPGVLHHFALPRHMSAQAHLLAAAPRLYWALKKALAEVDHEIENRKFSGNAEYWADLQAISDECHEAMRLAETA